MAGKTFRGVGDGEDPSLSRDAAPLIADEDDAQGLHSGPTVVDDKKVEEVLRKLRSLDKPPGPLTGVTQAVVDGAATAPVQIDPGRIAVDSGPQIQVDSGPARLEDVMYPLRQRATAIGRSQSTPAVGAPVTLPADAGRGTMFGRSSHLPELGAPEDVPIDESSGSVAPPVIDPGAAAVQPFGLADRRPLAPIAAPVERFHVPYEADLRTQLVDPPARSGRRLLALLGGAGLVALLWVGGMKLLGRSISGQAPAPAATQGSAAPAAATPAAAEPPAAPAAAIAPAPAPAAPAPSPAAATARGQAAEPRAAAADATDEPAPAARAGADRRSTSRHPTSSRGRHTARAPAETAEPSEAPPKPVRAHKRPGEPEDPDATLPPSM